MAEAIALLETQHQRVEDRPADLLGLNAADVEPIVARGDPLKPDLQ